MHFHQRSISLVFFYLVLLGGCGAGPTSHGQAVRGTVTVADQPLSNGLIILEPIEGTSGPTATAEIVEGKFEMSAELGPWPGKFRVKIESIPPAIAAIAAGKSPHQASSASSEPHREIAARFNRDSQTTVEILEGNNPPLSFDVQWQAR